MHGRPVAIIAHTVKGRGVPEAEFNYHWHTHAPSVAQAEAFLADLNRTYGRAEKFSRPLASPKDGGLEAVVAADLQ
jgi:transketolase